MARNSKKNKLAIRFAVTAIGMAAIGETSRGQVFTYTNNDLVLGFRKTGAFQETYEVVVNIGKAANYVQSAAGASFAVPNLSLSQITPGSFANLNHLSWSVFGYSKTNLTSVLPGYVNNTLWLTTPRSSPGTQTTPPARAAYSSQGQVGVQMSSAGNGGIYLSSQAGASNQFNSTKFIREPVNDPADLTSYVQAIGDPTGSTFRDTWSQPIEIVTPASFTSCLISDLYEVIPLTDQQNHPVTDPHTGQTSGPAYYVGYFQLCPDGTMTFVRASQSTLPPPPQVTVTRTGTTNLISFPSANGAVYTLYYTNSAGLTRPVSTWPSLPAVIIGDGSVKTFTNSAPDSERYYRVGAQ